VVVNAWGVEATSDENEVRSPETYIGYDRAENFVSPGGAVPDARHVYVMTTRLNEWGLSGDWTVGGERAVLNVTGGSIVYRFHARDLHPVLGPRPVASRSRFASPFTGRHRARAWCRCRCRRSGRRDLTATLSTRPAERDDQRPNVRNLLLSRGWGGEVDRMLMRLGLDGDPVRFSEFVDGSLAVSVVGLGCTGNPDASRSCRRLCAGCYTSAYPQTDDSEFATVDAPILASHFRSIS
jgi:hypothetical protein